MYHEVLQAQDKNEMSEGKYDIEEREEEGRKEGRREGEMEDGFWGQPMFKLIDF